MPVACRSDDFARLTGPLTKHSPIVSTYRTASLLLKTLA